MKTTVIHHSADFDGIFCREIARKFLPDAELIGWDFGDGPIQFPKEGQVYILDLPPDRPFGLDSLRNLGVFDFDRMVWIDHHASSIADYDLEPARTDMEAWCGNASKLPTERPPTNRQMAAGKIIPGYRIDGVAACRLAWQWLSGGIKSGIKAVVHGVEVENFSLPSKQDFIDLKVSEPLAVRLAGEYDIWDKRDPHAELFQHGLRSQDLGAHDWIALLDNIPDEIGMNITPSDSMVSHLLERGRAVQYAKTKENEDIITHYGFTIQFEGLTFLACNHARYNSHLFTAGLKPEHDACFGFKYAKGQWEVSLYHAPGKEHHDLSQIAVKYGGGGHRGACGFRAKTLPFLQ